MHTIGVLLPHLIHLIYVDCTCAIGKVLSTERLLQSWSFVDGREGSSHQTVLVVVETAGQETRMWQN